MINRHGSTAATILNSIGFKLFVMVIIITALVFFWSASGHRLADGSSDTWVDSQGHLHVLGIELGKTTLREAEIELKSRSDIAVYIYPVTHKRAGITLEAFFPAIADHSKVILELDAHPPLLEKLQQRATIPHIYPNAVARMNLHPEDLAIVHQLIVTKATLIPSIQISYEMLSKRFGMAASSNSTEDGTVHYDYPALGLRAILFKDGPARLQFSNP